jgi:hypothetical protein
MEDHETSFALKEVSAENLVEIYFMPLVLPQSR